MSIALWVTYSLTEKNVHGFEFMPLESVVCSKENQPKVMMLQQQFHLNSSCLHLLHLQLKMFASFVPQSMLLSSHTHDGSLGTIEQPHFFFKFMTGMLPITTKHKYSSRSE